MTINVKSLTIKPHQDKWVVPIEIMDKLGEFDLDVYAPFYRPFETALNYYTILDDGLNKPWYGRVFCHAPDRAETIKWLDKCAKHRNAIALVYAKTDTRYFHDIIIPKAHALLFIRGRVKFCYHDGTKADSAMLPSMLVAFDRDNALLLAESDINGNFIWLRK